MSSEAPPRETDFSKLAEEVSELQSIPPSELSDNDLILSFDKKASILTLVYRYKSYILSFGCLTWISVMIFFLMLAIGLSIPAALLEQQSLNIMTQSVSQKVASHVTDLVYEMFWNPVRTVNYLGNQLDIGLINRTDADNLSRGIYSIHKGSWAFGDLFVALDSNQMIGHKSVSPTDGLKYLRWGEGDERKLRIYTRVDHTTGDSNNHRLLREVAYPGAKYHWDITNLPWHLTAKSIKGLFWYGPYLGLDDRGDPAIYFSIVRPITNPEDNAVDGVVYMDFNTAYAESYLKNIDVGSNGRIIVADKLGNIMMRNLIGETTMWKTESGDVKGLKVWESNDTFTRHAGERLQEILNENINSHSVVAWVDGNWVSINFLRFKGVGLNWWIATVIPRSDYDSVVLGTYLSYGFSIMITMLVMGSATLVIAFLAVIFKKRTAHKPVPDHGDKQEDIFQSDGGV